MFYFFLYYYVKKYNERLNLTKNIYSKKFNKHLTLITIE